MIINNSLMKRFLFVLISIFLFVGSIMAQSSDPCDIVEAYVDQTKASIQFPIKVADRMYIQDFYTGQYSVVMVYKTTNASTFYYWRDHPKQLKKSVMEANKQMYKSQHDTMMPFLKAIIACGKNFKCIYNYYEQQMVVYLERKDIENIMK